MINKLSIIIPCYNQAYLLEKLFENLKEQTFKDFEIIIIDDNSTDDYKTILNKFVNNFSIKYIRNEKNLGAMQNMFNAITYPVKTEYVMCAHEDDYIHKNYLEIAINSLDKNSDAIFAGCKNVTFFNENDYLFKKNILYEKNYFKTYRLLNKFDFIKYILEENKITFGSIIYKSFFLKEKKPDLKKFSTLCDRPFLIELLNKQKYSILFDEIYYFYRDHGYYDNRSDKLNLENILNLYEYYGDNLNFKNDKKLKKIFYNSALNNTLFGFYSIKNRNTNFFKFIKKLKKIGILKFKYLNLTGFFAIIFLIFGKKISYYFIILKKKLNNINL